MSIFQHRIVGVLFFWLRNCVCILTLKGRPLPSFSSGASGCVRRRWDGITSFIVLFIVNLNISCTLVYRQYKGVPLPLRWNILTLTFSFLGYSFTRYSPPILYLTIAFLLSFVMFMPHSAAQCYKTTFCVFGARNRLQGSIACALHVKIPSLMLFLQIKRHFLNFGT